MRITLTFIGLVLLSVSIRAQSLKSPLLEITGLQAEPGQLLQVSFTDAGTGATNYVLESTSGSATWDEVPGSIILNLGDGQHQAVAGSPQQAVGLYRIVALGGSSGPVTATFTVSTLRLSEGQSAAVAVSFGSPYFGPLRYTLSGRTGAGELVSERGEVAVRGSAVNIPINDPDDGTVGQLAFFTLSLEDMPGMEPGAINQTFITVDENDAVWKGSLSVGGTEVGFGLRIEEFEGVRTGSLQGDGLGFFGAMEAPANLIFSDSVFQASIERLTFPAQASFVGADSEVSLSLTAVDGLEGQEVTGSLVKGVGTLIHRVPGQSHLDTTNTGPFLLLRQPINPSTNEVDLATAP